MLTLFRTKTFLKDYKRAKLTDKLYQKYVVYVSLLLQGKKLPVEARDHTLIGEYKNYREFHVSGDLLVIYVIDNNILKLVRVGSHSQLF